MAPIKTEVATLRAKYAALPANSHERPALLAEMRRAVAASLRQEVAASKPPFRVVEDWPKAAAPIAGGWLGRLLGVRA